ncbi:LysR family transcriptional regulator [Glutamicibacter sp. NPDC087673]|uniref:LysR family transcriptional regulator n=1 Tax=Glutamicibacter sp. NPDC087673 TaxID=3363997 RepID=UPI0037FCC449
MIDPRFATLRVFSSTGSVARTAELTGYSASAVSAQLRELQRTLGIKLITKEGRGVRLTSAGRHFVAGLDGIVTQWELLAASARNASGQVQGQFGLGGFSTAAAQLLAPLAANLRATRPDTEVQLIEAQPQRCLDLLLAERIDLAVIVASQTSAGSAARDRFEQTVLLDDPLDVVLPATHRLAQHKSVALEDLADDPWISESGQSVYRALFVAAFTSLGVTPHIAHEAVEWETMIAFIGAGLGVGLLPRLATLGDAQNVVRRRISGAAKPSRRIVAVTRKGSRGSPLIEESLGILQRTAKDIISLRSAEELDG